MIDRRIDRIARQFAATPSRRSIVRGIALPGMLAAGLTDGDRPATAARCRLAGQSCNRKKPCCAGAACREHVCVCPPDVAEPCAGRCCADCFGVAPDFACCPATKVCPGESGDLGDDVCCYPDEHCLDGTCCCDGCQGTEICAGICCRTACCGGTCCPDGQVCGRTQPGAQPHCIDLGRSCSADRACLNREQCLDGDCCPVERICDHAANGADGPVCCPAGHYCDRSNPSGTLGEVCCPVGTRCATFRPIRVRRT